MHKLSIQLSVCFLFVLLSGDLFSSTIDLPDPGEDIAVLKGILLEEENVPLGFATIVLKNQADSTIVDNALSDPDGSFHLTATPGSYYLEISFIGYEDIYITDIDLTPDNLDYNLGTIMMKTDAIALDEVLIRAERSQMEFKLDKRVFNVGKDLTNAGNTAADILDNVPSVNVDAEGNVSLRGSQGVRILIDGKPSGLISSGNTDALLRMQGDIIQSVEVITNPSAKYEAEGEAGILNIILKKNKEKGVNGSFGLTAGYPSNFGSSYNLNLRRNNFNFFSNFGLDYRKAPGGGFSTQQFFQNGVQSNFFTTDTDQERGGLGGYLQLGSDWNIDDNNLLTGSFLYKGGNSDNLSTVLYQDYDSNLNVLQATTREIIENEKDHNVEASLDFTRKFNRENQEFNFSFKYILNDDTEIADYIESSNNEFLSLKQNSDNTEDEENIIIQADYIQPWGNTGKIETGARAALRKVRNNFLVQEQVDEQLITIPGFDDQLQYDENIYAIYLNGSNEFGDFSVQAGLRAEFSDISASLVRSENQNIQDYLNLFPSATLAYKLSDSNQFQLSYSKRLSRPYFRRLLPFSNFNDPRSLRLGNPGLRPEYTDSYEFGFLKYFEKGTFLTNLYYRRTEGVIQTLTLPSDDGTTTRFPVNLASRNSYGLEFNFSYDFTANWDITTDLNFFKSTLNGTYEGKSYNAETFTWSGRINSKLGLGKQSQLQVSMNYRGPENTAQGRRLYSASLNMAASKDIFSGKGSVTLSVRDLLNTRKWRWRVDLPEYIAESEFQWRQARSVVLTFNYRLNQDRN